jgi:hypothetical protein
MKAKYAAAHRYSHHMTVDRAKPKMRQNKRHCERGKNNGKFFIYFELVEIIPIVRSQFSTN